ncbi:MAG TPA: efflux RND transporter periplasmic adaptor subunit [Polyangiaceae bacterium]|nr:efflux RND transporter periplasmic adaptor subunit [Polyangiaceae bacterium]
MNTEDLRSQTLEPSASLGTSFGPSRPVKLGDVLAVGRQRMWPFVAALVIGAGALVVTLSFQRKPPEEMSDAPGIAVGKSDVTLAKDAPQWKLLHVTPAVAKGENFGEPFPARFGVDEALAAKVGTPLAGRVSTVHVVLGQNVKAGQPLFSVTSPDIAGLRAEREKSAASLELAKAAYERVKAMVDARALPAKDALESNEQLREASLSLRLAESKLMSLKVSSRADNEFTVVSPRDGVVIEKNVLPAQQVSTETPLISVADLSTVRVVAELFEADAAGIGKGTQAIITSPSLPGLTLKASVELVSSVADPERHTVSVYARIPNPTGDIRPNAFAEMQLSGSAPAGAVEIPTSALVSDGSHQYVYVQDRPGHFVRRPVVAGSSHSDKLVIYSGLAVGELVVSAGAVLLDNQIALKD